MNYNKLYLLIAECLLDSFFNSYLSVSTSIIRRAILFFHSFSGNLPAVFIMTRCGVLVERFPSLIVGVQLKQNVKLNAAREN